MFLLLLLLASCAALETPRQENLKDLKYNLIQEIRDAVNDFEFTKNEPAVETFEATCVNPLTGERIPEFYANKRPYAVTFNNLKKALPQSGLSEAEIYYEVAAEGGITRIIGYSHNYSAEKIGPIRSARDYFFNFSQEADAIFIHHGGSPRAYEYISQNKLDTLDGIAYEGIYFYRDYDRARALGLEHSSYISAESILSGAKKFRSERESVLSFNFGDANEELRFENDATEITIPFSGYQTAQFIYHPEENIYYRSQNGEPHMDEYYGAQLSVSNILVQYAESKVVDDEGRMEYKLDAKGGGYFFSGGKYATVRWKNIDGRTKWSDESGRELVFNKGKTWIAVVEKKVVVNVGN
jgi:hypothetical protein